MVELSIRIALLGLIVGCGGRIYDLPDPPPPSERAPLALNPSDAQREQAALFVDARRAVLALYEAVAGERWEEVAAGLSNETRLLLTQGGRDDATEVLAAGSLDWNGRRFAFDPVTLFLIDDLERIEDEIDGESEHETSRRKEVFLVAADGEHRRVVLIDEGGGWRVHMRSIPRSLLGEQEGR